MRGTERRTNQGQLEPKTCALTGQTFDADLSTHRLEKLFNNRQTQAHPWNTAVLGSQPLEGLEQPFGLLGCDALTRVSYPNPHLVVLTGFAVNFDLTLIAVVLDRIG